MRLLLLSAGAASMYCGSCMRDNALAGALMKRGHEVTLLPFYTPTLTDEENVSRQERVFFGGISVYLEQHLSLFRHTPALLDKLWDAPWVIKAFSSGSIAVDPRMLGAMTVSTLEGEDGRQAKEIEKLVDWVKGEPRPDVVNIPYTLLISLARPLKRALGNVPVVVTLQGEDLFLEGLPEPYKSEALALIRAQAADVDLFVAISEYYAGFMQDYLRIPSARMRVAPLGVAAPAGLQPAPLARDPFTIGYFARVAPEKGLHVLAEAYIRMRREKGLPPSRLRAAGYRAPEQQAYFDGIVRTLAAAGLADEFHYAGAPDRAGKFAFLQALDVFCVPSPYHEPKGLYLLEAMAAGVPVVVPPHGAFPEIVRATGGGFGMRTGDADAVADALMSVWHHPDAAAACARNGYTAVRERFTLERMAECVEAVYGEASGQPVAGQAHRPYPTHAVTVVPARAGGEA
ncbi:MAG: glycosyltransferase family 4 protein [Gemmatimonadales bacterium]|nr:glycosyltransferase family 4 protein [Gemmatimonadales bacterium]